MQTDKNKIDTCGIGNKRSKMKSEVKLKVGLGNGSSHEGNRTMELVGVNHTLNMESELEKKKARGTDQTDSQRRT